MEEKQIRHFGNKMGRRSGAPLYDPHAVKGWWQFIDMQLNTKAKQLLGIMFDELETIWRFSMVGGDAPSHFPVKQDLIGGERRVVMNEIQIVFQVMLVKNEIDGGISWNFYLFQELS